MIDNVDDVMGGFVSFRPLLEELVRTSHPLQDETGWDGSCIPTPKGNKSSMTGENHQPTKTQTRCRPDNKK